MMKHEPDYGQLQDLMVLARETLRLEDALRVEASPMRLAILLSQVGDLARYVSHDERLNATRTRPHGSRGDEVATFGHALGQLLCLAASRGLTPLDVEMSAAAWATAMRERDWAVSDEPPRGVSAGSQQGFASRLTDVKPGPFTFVVFEEHLRAEHVPSNVAAIVTRHGGTSCHAAIIARERGIPCVVGYKGEPELGSPYRVTVTDEGLAEVKLL